MLLLLDLGNSRCKFALSDGSDIQHVAYVEYGNRNVSIFESIFEKNTKIDKIIACSVLEESFILELITYFKSKNLRQIYFVSPVENTFEIQPAYRNIKQLGADRIAAMVAAHNLYSGHKCVIDCGTAITIDALNNDGVHKGGVIFPGQKTMVDALLQHTSISMQENLDANSVFSTSTEEAAGYGSLSAVIGGIKQVVNEMQRDEKFDSIVLTGGGAKKIQNSLALPIDYNENLVLTGLHIISEKVFS